MKKIYYISRINLLSGRTNVYNLAKTCEALNAQKDFTVKLVTTNQSGEVEAFFKKMGIHRPFEVICLGKTRTVSKFSGRAWYEFLMILFANFSLFYFTWQRSREFDIIYFRDESLFLTAFWVKAFLQKRVFFEIHSVLGRFHRQRMNIFSIRLANGVIAISAGLKRYYQSINKNILVSLCSAAEESWFDYSKNKGFFREQLNLPVETFIVGYTGVTGANPNNDYYELDDIVKSLISLPPKIVFVVVGELNGNAGWLRDLAQESGVAERVIIRPWRERNEISKYLQAFDVNLIPKRKKDLVGDSPAKMFPALAARRPIIAGRAECIEEVLTDNVDALIVETNDPAGWTGAILKIYNDHDLAEKLSNQASVTNGYYTWERRGMTIAEFINKTIKSVK